MGLSKEVSCEAWSFSYCLNPHRFFSVRGFEALSPCAGTLGRVIYLTPKLFLLIYPHTNAGPPTLPAASLPSPPATTLLYVLSIPAARLTPPTSLDECFFFNSLVVGLPYSSILWQFWLFFVFKFVIVLILVVRGYNVYLLTPPSWLEVSKVKE